MYRRFVVFNRVSNVIPGFMEPMFAWKTNTGSLRGKATLEVSEEKQHWKFQRKSNTGSLVEIKEYTNEIFQQKIISINTSILRNYKDVILG